MHRPVISKGESHVERLFSGDVHVVVDVCRGGVGTFFALDIGLGYESSGGVR